VLGGKQRGDCNTGVAHGIHVAVSLLVDSGLIRNQSDAFAAKRLKLILFQNVEAGVGLQ
jgi:hypothetical protein